MIFRKRRFADLIARQLDLFQREHADVIAEAQVRLDAYNRADRDEAEELYGDFVDAVETGTEILADMRWGTSAPSTTTRRRSTRPSSTAPRAN